MTTQDEIDEGLLRSAIRIPPHTEGDTRCAMILSKKPLSEAMGERYQKWLGMFE